METDCKYNHGGVCHCEDSEYYLCTVALNECDNCDYEE